MKLKTIQITFVIILLFLSTIVFSPDDFLRLQNANGTQLIINSQGKIYAKEIQVTLDSPLGDFVFEKNYDLLSLKDLEEYINLNKHLPGIPSAETVKEEGLNIAEMEALLLQKIEELTLYTIQLHKKILEQQEIINNFNK